MEFLPNQKKYETDKKITVIFSVLDPKLIILDPDPDPQIENQEFQIRIRILDPDPSVN